MEAGKCVFDTQKVLLQERLWLFHLTEPLRLLIQPFLKKLKKELRRKNKFIRFKPSDGGGGWGIRILFFR